MTVNIHVVFACLAFVFGGYIGSFLNVCLWRIPRKESGEHVKAETRGKVFLSAAFTCAFACGAGAVAVANVQARQRPKSDIVDVYYDLVAGEGGVFDVSVSIEGGGDKPVLSTLRGDVRGDERPSRLGRRGEADAGGGGLRHGREWQDDLCRHAGRRNR